MALKQETVKRLISYAGLLMVFCLGLLSIIASGGVGGLEGENVVSIEIVPANVTLQIGGTQTFEVKVHTDDGGSDVTGADSWNSSDTAVATIAADGVATAVAAGVTTITATKAGLSAETTLTVPAPIVPPPALTAITITPADPHIPFGATQTLTATGTYEDGSTKDITNFVAWTSSNTSVATIDTNGVVNTFAKGTATITASRNGLNSQTSVTVTDPALVSIQVEPGTVELLQNTSHAFTAIGTYSDASTADVTTAASWTSSDASIATVDDTGLVTAKTTDGETTITATVQQISGAATVTVFTGTLKSIIVSPVSASVEIGFTQAFTALGNFSDGSNHDLTDSVIWSLSDNDIALLNQSGLITARTTGSTDVIATLGIIHDTASLTVTADTLASIRISPINPAMIQDETLQFTATGIYKDNSEKDFSQLVDWNSSDSDVTTIDATGLATSIGPTGLVTITANLDSFSSNTSLLVVTPGLPRTGQTTCYDVDGATIDCSGTGQDGDSQSGKTWPSPRFTSGTGDEIDCITDNLTGLMWAKDSIGSMQWQEALDNANSLDLCGHDDWRMPNFKEMDSLVNREQADSVAWLKSEGFANISNSNYWTSTTVPNATDRAFDPILSSGTQSTALKTSTFPSFLPVRSTQTTAAAPVVATGQMTCFDASGVETECTNTGQDGDLQQGLIWPSPRFVTGTDAEADCVTDKLTGLMWLKTPDSTPRTWQQALSYANSLNQCGHADWRVPNTVELYSLYNAGEVDGATWLNSQSFSNVQYGAYWTSTTQVTLPTNAQILSLTAGFLNYAGKTETRYAWPVRGGSHK